MKATSFLDLAVTLSGPPTFPPVIVDGWSDGNDALTMKRRTKGANMKVGANGRAIVSLSADRSGEFHCKLWTTSPTNKYFNTLFNLQQGGSRTFIPSVLTFADLYRQDRIIALPGFIEDLPEVKKGDDVPDAYEWVVVVPDMQMFFENPLFTAFATALAEAQL